MTQDNQNQTNPNENENKLYAGKFKTVEDLETGYKNAATVYDENEKLKKQMSELSEVPSSYLNPADLEVDQARATDIQARAKEAGMTQAQYEKFLRSDKARVEQQKQNFEKAKKELGEETMNLIQDFVNKAYPKEVAEGIINATVVNKEARQAILNQRQRALDNRMPGMEKPSHGGYTVSDEDIRKAYAQKEKTKMPNDINRYLNLVAQKAVQA
jgi:hypothetical protein